MKWRLIAIGLFCVGVLVVSSLMLGQSLTTAGVKAYTNCSITNQIQGDEALGWSLATSCGVFYLPVEYVTEVPTLTPGMVVSLRTAGFTDGEPKQPIIIELTR